MWLTLLEIVVVGDCCCWRLLLLEIEQIVEQIVPHPLFILFFIFKFLTVTSLSSDCRLHAGRMQYAQSCLQILRGRRVSAFLRWYRTRDDKVWGPGKKNMGILKYHPTSLISYERVLPGRSYQTKPGLPSGCQVNTKCFYVKSTCLGSNYKNINSRTLVQNVHNHTRIYQGNSTCITYCFGDERLLSALIGIIY
jgi:hypothetical protein